MGRLKRAPQAEPPGMPARLRYFGPEDWIDQVGSEAQRGQWAYSIARNFWHRARRDWETEHGITVDDHRKRLRASARTLEEVNAAIAYAEPDDDPRGEPD